MRHIWLTGPGRPVPNAFGGWSRHVYFERRSGARVRTDLRRERRMDQSDQLLVKQIKTQPWRELSLCGAAITESERPGKRAKDAPVRVLDIHLAWVEQGQVGDEYHVALTSIMGDQEKLELCREIVAFARGALPVAWGLQSKAVLHRFIADHETEVFPRELDTTLCFLLRPKSRWLDPMIWTRVRTGKFHELETIMKAVGLVRSHSRAIDVAALAYQLPTRNGFPVKPKWTATDTAEWQDMQRIF